MVIILAVINSPWKDDFFDLIANTKESIKICSPFIKYNIVEEIYNIKAEDAKVYLITNFNLANFYRKASDIEAIDYIIRNKGEVKNCQNLHAKIYIFDDRISIITSANLTSSGLSRNFEYGVICDEPSFTIEVCKNYDSLYKSRLSDQVVEDDVNEVYNILNGLPKEKKVKIPRINLHAALDEEDELLTVGYEYIEKSLSGWKLEVFKDICKIDKMIFNLDDIYKFKGELHKIFPGNNFIEAKIRQVLQGLRNIGLIKFLGNGEYKKLFL